MTELTKDQAIEQLEDSIFEINERIKKLTVMKAFKRKLIWGLKNNIDTKHLAAIQMQLAIAESKPSAPRIIGNLTTGLKQDDLLKNGKRVLINKKEPVTKVSVK